MLKPKTQALKYIVSDYLAAFATWITLYLLHYVSARFYIFDFVRQDLSENIIYVLIILPPCWLVFYYLSGQYHNPYHRSRLQELWKTIVITVAGNTVIFFVFILDTDFNSYMVYYNYYYLIILVHFIYTYIPRLIITTLTIFKIRSDKTDKIKFNTIFIGGGIKTVQFYKKLNRRKGSSGHNVIGFVSIIDGSICEADKTLLRLGNIKDVKEIIKEQNIHEVIIASESKEQKEVEDVIAQVDFLDVKIRLIPNLHNILTGRRIISSLYGSPLLEISRDLMPVWQQNAKRIIDIVGAALGLIICSPLFLFTAIKVRLSSEGPIFYNHERIGKFGESFKIYKFRSMYVNAEEKGPALSSQSDPRVTPFGRIMRKYRLDEIPQLYNVLKGDMSLVGPRPERQFFIDQITKKAPYYTHLLKARPGITSWGQVKFGYAESVDQMIERLQYDLIYIENMSIYFDIKILIYTIRTIFEGKGM